MFNFENKYIIKTNFQNFTIWKTIKIPKMPKKFDKLSYIFIISYNYHNSSFVILILEISKFRNIGCSALGHSKCWSPSASDAEYRMAQLFQSQFLEFSYSFPNSKNSENWLFPNCKILEIWSFPITKIL